MKKKNLKVNKSVDKTSPSDNPNGERLKLNEYMKSLVSVLGQTQGKMKGTGSLFVVIRDNVANCDIQLM